jgi:uncharacterized surface protein with fasciclin (FAS1) repeats
MVSQQANIPKLSYDPTYPSLCKSESPRYPEWLTKFPTFANLFKMADFEISDLKNRTLFIPVDMPNITYTSKYTAKHIIMNHVFDGCATVEDMCEAGEFIIDTRSGLSIAIYPSSEELLVNRSKVVNPNYVMGEFVVHIIDKML